VLVSRQAQPAAERQHVFVTMHRCQPTREGGIQLPEQRHVELRDHRLGDHQAAGVVVGPRENDDRRHDSTWSLRVARLK